MTTLDRWPVNQWELDQLEPQHTGVPVSPVGARNFLHWLNKPLKQMTAEEVARLSDQLDRLAMADAPTHLRKAALGDEAIKADEFGRPA